MSEPRTTPPKPGSKLGIWIAAIAVILFGAYYGITHYIRQHVTGLIKANEQKPLPEFALEDLRGNTWTRASVADKIVVLNFFRSRCPNCTLEMPVIKQLVRAVDKDKIVVLGIMTDRVLGFGESETEATLAKYGYEHPVLMANEAFADAFHKVGWAHVTPVTYVVNTKGVIVHALRGHQTLPALKAAIAF